MAVRDWSFARLLVVLTLGSSVSLGLGLATVGAYLAAPDDDQLVRFWEQNRWLLLPACAGFLASVFALCALVAAWATGRLRRPPGDSQSAGGRHQEVPTPSRRSGRDDVLRPGLSAGMHVRGANGRRLRWWEIAGLLAAVGAALWGRAYRRTISAEEMCGVVGIVALGIAVARPWRAGSR